MSRMYANDTFFFFQAEDGIRDATVTGVQTCALPIARRGGGGQSQGAADRLLACAPSRSRLPGSPSRLLQVRRGGDGRAGEHVSDAGGQRLTQVRTMAEPRCWSGSVAGPGLAVFAAVVQEPQDAEAAAAAEREQRHLDGQEGSRFGPAGERGR